MATLHTSTRGGVGRWSGPDAVLVTEPRQIAEALARVRRPIYLLDHGGAYALAEGGRAVLGEGDGDTRLWAVVPPCPPERLGARSFCIDHGLRFAYVAGAMAGGIGSVDVVEAMGRAGLLGFFGAAGLDPAMVDDAIDRISTRLPARPWGFNLIHSPFEPRLEEAVADLYVRRGVRLVEASAYLDLTLPLVRYRVHGIGADQAGRVVAPNRVVAKVSRAEVARKFFSPPPERMLAELVRRGDLAPEQARMAAAIPVAQDLTAEADSGGHTDRRPALSLLPSMLALRDRLQMQHGYDVPLRVGAAGGIATPHAVAAAFAMGADYVLSGSINQACVEAGTSDPVRRQLAQAEPADVAMAPAADMFELGVDLQVLRRGTMFAQRARKLHELYRAHSSLDELPAAERQSLEQTLFRAPLPEIWRQTREFWAHRDPAQVERAEREPRHRLALVFRWYLGMSSRWANRGEPGRELDYQIWCGPGMGAFNEWARGSFLEGPEQRRVVTLAHNLIHGAAVLRRVAALREQDIDLPSECVELRPREPWELEELLA